MEFELLDNPDFQPNPFEAVRKFLQAPRKQMQAWGDKAPVVAAAAVYGLVIVEWVLAWRVSNGMGRGPSSLTQAFLIAAAILVAAGATVNAAAALAAVGGKVGSRRVTLAYLFLGLAPLLLVLPVTLLCEAADMPGAMVWMLTLLLILKVAGFWREAIETTFKLNRLQSALALYGAASAVAGIALLLVYAMLMARISMALR